MALVHRRRAHRRRRTLPLFITLGLLVVAMLLPAPSSALAAAWQPASTPGWRQPLAPILLANGRLLVAGGINSEYLSKQSALYTPQTDTWAATGDLTTVRAAASLTALPDGGALAAGGIVSSSEFGATSAERFDPETRSWRTVASMKYARHGHAAAIIGGGKVLVVGGVIFGASRSSPTQPLSTVEIYDPVADSWRGAAPLPAPFRAPQIRLLADGTVLAVSGDGQIPDSSEAQLAARYDPVADRWTALPRPPRAHGQFTLTVLQDGRTLIVGGNAQYGGAGIFDPATNAWTRVDGPSTPRVDHTATLLPSGEVLVTGGRRHDLTTTNTTERFDARTNTWRADAPLLAAREGHDAILVLDTVYALGGGDGAERLALDTSDSRCFAETGRCAQGRFLAYWNAHGGLAINGYPLSAPFAERLEDGRVYLVQYFERTRMEYHPEHAAPNDVLLGQFGRRIYPADPPAPRAPGAAYFPQTGHNLGGAFRAYWEANGGLAQFGYPLTEEFKETLEDGKEYTVQYFERARFEHHPENPAPYDVLLGQFGRRILAGR